TSNDIVTMLEAFLNGVIARGKATPGEKTMIDALTPALEAARNAARDGATLAEVTMQASQAAEAGMKATIPMQATKGRASYLGERSVGHQDPGATSSWLILRALAEVCTA
ncbi:MAG: DAK2 domain-containing protein, partial [Ktedonobacteraceae bacterium]|nr:DAK2 domain-containing protein [Ktedonobacteraceae bacterium]